MAVGKMPGEAKHDHSAGAYVRPLAEDTMRTANNPDLSVALPAIRIPKYLDNLRVQVQWLSFDRIANA